MTRTIFTLAGALALAQSATADSAAWIVSESVDPISDYVSKSAIVQTGNFALLAVSCTERGLFAFVQTRPVDIQFEATRPVSWRVDSQGVHDQRWHNGQKSGAGIFEDEARDFAHKVSDAKERIVVRSGGETVTFAATGSTRAVGEVLQHCER
jgi:hypothetical protein